MESYSIKIALKTIVIGIEFERQNYLLRVATNVVSKVSTLEEVTLFRTQTRNDKKMMTVSIRVHLAPCSFVFV